MYIFSKEKLKNTEIIGSKMLLTYLEEDESKLKDLIDVLDAQGIYYSSLQKSLKICKKNQYLLNAEKEIEGSKIAVIVLSKAFFEEQNRVLQNLTWYETGCLLGQNKKIVLYFLDIDKNELQEKLYKTPVRQIQGCNKMEDLLEFIATNNIMENLFYSDGIINRFASKRIFFVKLTTIFNIYRTNIAEITSQFNRFGNETYDEKTVLDLFLQELVSGCTVLSFNRKNVLGKEFTPYLEETEILTKDFPVNFQYSKPELLEYSSADDIYATVKSEFIIPMHALLGVDFKPFLAIKRRSKFKTDQMLSILKKNFNSSDLFERDIYIKNDEHLQRVYFLLDLEVFNTQKEAVGKKANYLYPQ